MNEEPIFIASFADKCIREKVMMNQPDDDDPWYQEKYEAHVDSRRTFSYPVKEEQDGKEIPESEFRLQHQFMGLGNEWVDCDNSLYGAIKPEFRRIIAIPIDKIGDLDYKYEEGLSDDIQKKPKIVCLCGSTRFMEAFQEANLKLTCEGKIVLSVGCNTKSDRDLLFSGELTEELKKKLDELHKRKIDLADEVFVLNVGGYIGESTRSEINYAKDHNKPIKYLVP